MFKSLPTLFIVMDGIVHEEKHSYSCLALKALVNPSMYVWCLLIESSSCICCSFGKYYIVLQCTCFAACVHFDVKYSKIKRALLQTVRVGSRTFWLKSLN